LAAKREGLAAGCGFFGVRVSIFTVGGGGSTAVFTTKFLTG
jgi:hypothetical protein